ILDGTDAIMLSGETAAGDFPVESVDTMNTIALQTETALDHEQLLKNRSRSISMTITDAISQSVTHTSQNLGGSAIITPPHSGHSSQMVAKYRPKVTINAVTFSKDVCRRLILVWCVYTVLSKQAYTTDEFLDVDVHKALNTNIISQGCKVIISAGVAVGVSGTTNMMKVHVIGNVLANGTGVGRHYAYGNTIVTNNAEEANKRMKEGDLLVTYGTDKDMMPALEKAGGIVTEE